MRHVCSNNVKELMKYLMKAGALNPLRTKKAMSNLLYKMKDASGDVKNMDKDMFEISLINLHHF